MARKKGSAAKFMHGATTRIEQLQAGMWGPMAQSHVDEIEFMAHVGIVFFYNGQDAHMEEQKTKLASELLTRFHEARKTGEAGFLRRLADVIERKGPMCEPWRVWLVETYAWEGMGPYLRPPAVIGDLLQEIANRFGVHLDANDLRKELRALAVPFEKSSPGRKRVKKRPRKNTG